MSFLSAYDTKNPNVSTPKLPTPQEYATKGLSSWELGNVVSDMNNAIMSLGSLTKGPDSGEKFPSFLKKHLLEDGRARGWGFLLIFAALIALIVNQGRSRG